MTVHAESVREQVMALRRSGVSCRRIASETGVSYSTVYRWLHPDYAERQRHLSREAKMRRTGRCVNCGATTRYNGHERAVSALCHACACRRAGDERRDTGPIWNVLIGLLSAGVPVRFSVLRAAIVSAGGQPDSIFPLLYQRLIPRGYARRIARGVYVAGPALTNGTPGACDPEAVSATEGTES